MKFIEFQKQGHIDLLEKTGFSFIATDPAKQVLWASKNFLTVAQTTMPEIKSKPITGIVHVFREDPTGIIHCKIPRNASFLSDEFHAEINVFGKHDDFLLFSVQYFHHSLEFTFSRYDNSFYALLDDSMNINACSSNLRALLSGIAERKRIRGSNIEDFIDDEDFKLWKEGRARILSHAASAADNAGHDWETVYSAGRQGFSAFFAESAAEWQIGEKACFFAGIKPSYFISGMEFDFFRNDVRIECGLKNSNGGITLCASTDHFTSPDEDGYLLFFNRHLMLKRNTETVAFFPGITTAKHLVIEKSGICLKIWADGILAGSYMDLVPMYQKENQRRLGLYTLAGETFSDLKILTRKSSFDYAMQSECRRFVHLKGNKSAFFDLQIIPAEYWDKKVQLMQLTRLSELKAAEERLVAYRKELDKARTRLLASESGFHGLVGKSAAVENILSTVRAIAKTDTTAFLTGETGVGKDMVALAIHAESGRRGAFVKVDCSTLPANLMESELFGHEKGAFTGADRRKTGKFELADKGTLFIDEIGNLPLELQAKLLRFLQDRQFERLGGDKTLTSNARIVVATNLEMEKAVAEGKFRSDLFYRIKVVAIHIPPLRERLEDIQPLLHFFLGAVCTERRIPMPVIDNRLLPLLLSHAWPGNVRELKNAIEHAVLLHLAPEKLGTLSVEHFPESVRNPQPQETIPGRMNTATGPKTGNRDRELFVAKYLEFKGKPRLLARFFNCSRDTIRNRIREYRLDKKIAFGADQAIAHFSDNPFTIKEFLQFTGLSFPTARRMLDALVQEKKIREKKEGRTVIFHTTASLS